MSQISSPTNATQMPPNNFEASDRSFRVAQGHNPILSNEVLNSGASPAAPTANQGVTAAQHAAAAQNAAAAQRAAAVQNAAVAQNTAVAQNAAAVQGAAVIQGVAAALQPAASQSSGAEVQSRLAQLDQRIGQLGEQLHKLATHFKLINSQIESLDQRVDSVAAASESQAASTPTDGPSVEVLASKIDARFESLENIFKAQCEMVSGFLGNSATNNGDLKIKMNTRSAVETESSPPVSTAPLAEPAEVDAGAVSVEDDSVSDWQKQKQAMMAMYGGESEPTEPEVTTPAEMNASQPQADALDSGDSGTAASEPPVSTEEKTVDALKAELNSKIREAEVEMSINRARLMQERVEFERAQANLERRAARLEAKLTANSGDDRR